jgi:hypothetical protein
MSRIRQMNRTSQTQKLGSRRYASRRPIGLISFVSLCEDGNEPFGIDPEMLAERHLERT